MKPFLFMETIKYASVANGNATELNYAHRDL